MTPSEGEQVKVIGELPERLPKPGITLVPVTQAETICDINIYAQVCEATRLTVRLVKKPMQRLDDVDSS